MTSLRVGPLVRAVDAESARLWIELPHAGAVTLSATPIDTSAPGDVARQPHTATVPTVTVSTVRVGGRYYAAPQLTGLRPATWYHYQFQARHNTALDSTIPGNDTGHTLPLQCFRTLDEPQARRPLTLAYGSCRKLSDPRRDVLSAFGDWLVRHHNERETLWPRLLLLIGDQIYADEPPAAAVRANPRLRGGAKSFAEFASLYEFAWTRDKNVRQALAVLPTYMICDDHEITNNWNNRPFWRATALRHASCEQLLVDGLVAYWVYQAWGNLLPATENDPSGTRDTLGRDTPLHVMQEAARSGEDALEPLRDIMRRAVYGETRLRWHYTVPTSPPLFVADARADREARFNRPVRRSGRNSARKSVRAADEETPSRIMSREQMGQLKAWLGSHDDEMALIVSSVPVLLPPIIGLAEYIMGKRIDPARSRSWRWPLRLLGHLQQKIATRTSFDHWPLFGATWQELVQLFATRRHDILVLSGDVHFSYTMEARLAHAVSSKAISSESASANGASSDGASASTREGRGACLYQFVCSPFQNTLGAQSRRRILAQARRQHATYGGLNTRVRHLKGSTAHDDKRGIEKRIHHNLLLGNALAVVRFQPQQDGRHQVSQRYFGLHEGRFLEIASATLQVKPSAEVTRS